MPLIRNAIALQTGAALSGEEKRARAKFGPGQLGDIVIRVGGIGPDFFEQIYYPIGGLDALLKARSRRGFQSAISKASEGIEDVIPLVLIFHYHVEFLLNQRRFGKPSVNKGADLVSQLAFHGRTNAPEGRTIKKRWARFKDSAAFSYSASGIEFQPGITLLDDLKRGEFSLDKYGSLLPEWFGKAKDVNDRILRQLPKTPTLKLSGIEVIPLPAPPFNAGERDIIERAFLSKRLFRGERQKV